MGAVLLGAPEQGQLVRVRSRQWVVNEVKPSTLPPPAMKPSFDGVQNLITLASVEDDGLRDMPATFRELGELLEDHGIGCRASDDQVSQILDGDAVGDAVIDRMIGTAVNMMDVYRLFYRDDLTRFLANVAKPCKATGLGKSEIARCRRVESKI